MEVELRQEHRGGEKLFVDYVAGDQLPQRRDPPDAGVRCGVRRIPSPKQLRSQQLPDWLGSHARYFAFLGGVPEIVVLDNLRTSRTSTPATAT